MTKQSPQRQPSPNVLAILGRTEKTPWITLHGLSLPLIADAHKYRIQLTKIDRGLEIVETSDDLAIRVQPTNGCTRTRSELADAVKKLARSNSNWVVKWYD